MSTAQPDSRTSGTSGTSGPTGTSGPADPEHPDKPGSPSELRGPTRKYVLRKTIREFSADECTDLAAALTYYLVLALFPAVIALLSLIGVFGQPQATVDTLLGILTEAGAGSAAESIRPTIESLSTAPGAGIGLIVGVAGAVFSASGYVGAFGRAMNRIYGVGEGRPFWKLRPKMFLVTLLLLVLVALALVILVVSGPVTQSLGSAIGLGSAAVLVWQIAKWPVLLIVVVAVVATLYRTTPNVQQPKMKWLSLGALVAILTWIVASALFGFYVANFGSYNATYGAFAGVIIFLLWLWLTNVALLFGAELDAELERGRELQAGQPAEEEIQLPLRDRRNVDKANKTHADDVARGRKLRESRGARQQTDRDT